MNWYISEKSIHTAATKALDPSLNEMAKNQPWAMPQKQFLNHHYTGYIQPDAYQNYSTIQGLNWVKPENYPQHYATVNFNGTNVEIRRNNTKNQYNAYDENGNIKRGPDGMALNLTDEEIKAKGYTPEDGGMAAFVNGQCIGFASNEFGSTGVWVVSQYQRKGIGTYLIREFIKTNPKLGRIGQMTNAGINMTKSYHKSLVQDAIKNNHPVPPEVRQEYNL